MFAFQYPWMLLLLFLPPLLWWLKQRRQTALRALALGSAQNIKPRITWRIRMLHWVKWMPYAALTCCLIALGRPQLVDVQKNVNGQGIDIMLALDISPSMLARDFTPDRLAVAKRVAMDFVRNRPVDRIGLVSFAGEAIVEYPLTTDHALILNRIDAMHVGDLADGTAIGMGLGTALTRLRDTSNRSRIVILVTDGENNAGYYSPEQATEIAVTLGVKVYTIGIGTDDLAEAPIARNPDGSYEFAPRRLVIDAELLQRISSATGGKSFLATSENALRQIYSEIERMERSTYEVKEIVHRTDLFYIPLLLGLLALLLDALIRWRWAKTIHST